MRIKGDRLVIPLRDAADPSEGLFLRPLRVERLAEDRTKSPDTRQTGAYVAFLAFVATMPTGKIRVRRRGLTKAS